MSGLFDPRAILRSPRIYDALQVCMGARKGRRNFIEKYVCPKSGDRILDIGCGTGLTLNFLPDDVTYYGFDGDSAYIEYARAKFGRRATFRCQLIQEPYSLRGQKFDSVIATGVLHHLDDDTCANLFETARSLLAPEGRLVTKDPCYHEGQGYFARTLVGYDRGAFVRRAAQYEQLVRRFFVRTELTIESKVIPPYSHAVVIATT